MFYYMSTPRSSCQVLPKLENSPLGPKKVRNDPKIKLSSKFTIEENIENKSFSTT